MSLQGAWGFNARIVTVPHGKQRYPTCGDWQAPVGKETLRVTVSEMGDRRYEALVAIHELIEGVLCIEAGVSQEAVDAFDREFEQARAASVGVFAFRGRSVHPDAEPGDQPDAPYYRQHQFATVVERMLAVEMGVSWMLYEGTVNDL